ncbi:hypothetical protein ZIOFF_073723 [Zingiber officinale]|uniref:Uncharacterized protein n=1 Tax=Zingiber officinale TaxID=94328 RepID=A0A8J5BYH4_ZINOF|nr:hypothetical protein ZIOFF_073723 [Zingiber officinale]
MEDPSTKAYLKTMATKALWQLTKGNTDICKSITKSQALLCFAVLLEKGGDVRYNSAMVLMEIAVVAEYNADLRRSAFKPYSLASKAFIEQFLQIVERGSPLVHLLDDKAMVVMREVVVALTKFACTQNYLHVTHPQTIIDSDGARHLVQLVYYGKQVQHETLILLCYITKHVLDS